MNTVTFKEIIRRWKKDAGTESVALISSIVEEESGKCVAILNICTHGVKKWQEFGAKYLKILVNHRTDNGEAVVNVPGFEKITFTESTWLV